SIVVSDTTGNVKKCRAMICKRWPWILNCPDPCHQLNLMMKDIMVMAIISVITTYFSHSNYATHHLKEELKKEKDQRGIQVAGATRFSSFSIHARSISRCLYPIQRCLVSGTIKFDTKAYLMPGTDCLKFQMDLHNVNQLLTPITRGLETLEGQNTTCSDVFHVYTGIAVNFVTMFSDKDSLVYQYRTATFNIYNRRFNNFMNDCTPGMFILAYLLDPGKHLRITSASSKLNSVQSTTKIGLLD
ncbi:hypothetical protein FIBSPDRAFT_727407, partial [Athelia psychrophila]